MSKGINKTISIGNLCANPETRYLPSGGAVTNIRIAMNDYYKDKTTGQKVEKVEYMSVVFFNRLAEIAAEYLKKGSKVYIEGSLRTRKWQGQDGQDRYTTEIVASDMQMLDGRGTDDMSGANNRTSGAPSQPSKQPPTNQPMGTHNAGDPGFDSFDDDIPF